MYDKLFEIIKKNKLTNQSRIEKAVFQDLTFSKLFRLAEELYLSIESESPQPKISSLQDYHFLANSNMSGIYHAGCTEWACRLNRVERLARFATLYADCIYIRNYFAEYQHTDIDSRDLFFEQSFRDSIAGSLKIIIELESLIKNGIVSFIPTLIMLCSHCQAKLTESINTTDSRIDKQIKTLDEFYSRTTSAKLIILPTPSPPGDYRFEIRVDCDEELFEHGGYMIGCNELRPILRRKITKKPLVKEFQLSRYEILRGHINTHLLKTIASDVSCSHIYRARSNLKYLTDRKLDISLLQATTEEEHLSKYNEVLNSQLVFEMPVFQNIPLSSLLKIRSTEYDAFNSYRNTISDLISKYISQNKEISPLDAKQIYSDVIQPKVRQLDNRISRIRKSSIMKSIPDVVISTGALTLGLCASFVSPILQTALVSLGLVESAKVIFKALPSTLTTPGEIRNDNLYFLWKLSKKAKII